MKDNTKNKTLSNDKDFEIKNVLKFNSDFFNIKQQNFLCIGF